MTDSIYYYSREKMLSVRYEDIIKRKPKVEKTAQEILDETMLKAGLTFKR